MVILVRWMGPQGWAEVLLVRTDANFFSQRATASTTASALLLPRLLRKIELIKTHSCGWSHGEFSELMTTNFHRAITSRITKRCGARLLSLSPSPTKI